MTEADTCRAYLDGLRAQVAKVRGLQEASARELEAMMPSILDRAFKHEAGADQGCTCQCHAQDGSRYLRDKYWR